MTITNCAVCGKGFKSYNPRPQFCSWSCKHASERAPIAAADVVRLYQSGMTKAEVAAILNTSVKVVANRLRDAGVKCRRAVKRDQRGAKNASWRGNDATYAAFHHRVEAVRGTPCRCEHCGTTDAPRYEWANLTGHYADVNDFARLCVPCHRRYDAARRKATGALTSAHVRGARKEVQHAG